MKNWEILNRKLLNSKNKMTHKEDDFYGELFNIQIILENI